MTERVGIEVFVDPSKAAANIDRLSGNLQRVIVDIRGLDNATGQVNRTMDATSGMATMLSSAISGIVTYQTIKSVLGLADSYTSLQQRLKVATESQEAYLAAAARTYQISQQNNVETADTVALFQRLKIGAAELGQSDENILRVTSAIQQMGALSGASAQEIQNAAVQLSQGLAGGVIRAEEFNSIVENTPLLAKRIAEAFGISMGELRAAMLDGKLTSEAMFDAIMAKAGETEEEFSKMQKTVSQSWQMVENSIEQYIGKANEQMGVTQDISLVMQEFAKTLDDVDKAQDKLSGSRNLDSWKETARNASQETAVGFRYVSDEIERTILGIIALKDASAALSAGRITKASEIIGNFQDDARSLDASTAAWEKRLKAITANRAEEERIEKLYEDGVLSGQSARSKGRLKDSHLTIEDYENKSAKTKEAKTPKAKAAPEAYNFTDVFGTGDTRLFRDYYDEVEDVTRDFYSRLNQLQKKAGDDSKKQRLSDADYSDYYRTLQEQYELAMQQAQEAEDARYADQYQRLVEAYGTESDQLRFYYQDQLDVLESAHERQMQLEQGTRESKILLEQEYQRTRAAIQDQWRQAEIEAEAAKFDKLNQNLGGHFNRSQQWMKKYAQLDKSSYVQRSAYALGFMSDLLAITSDGSKKSFEIQKMVKRAEVLVTTPSAAMAAYEGGLKASGGNPVVGAAFAAMAVAEGALQLRNINSTSFNGGGSMSTGGGGGASSISTPTSLPAPTPVAEKTPVSITLNLNGYADKYTIMKAVQDGVKLGLDRIDIEVTS